MEKKGTKTRERPPVVAIVGHIDHGKSTLLDYIRRTNVVGGEAGGITQHLSAYEAKHQNASGEHLITFLDTPGHEAFRSMRARGLEVADVAILVISAEDGVKVQTLEALKLIEEAKIPYIVAFTKIDKESANLDRAKTSLLEHNVFLEGLGGTVPSVAVSGKTGEGIPELLDLILLAAELEGLSSDISGMAEGVVIEAHTESKRGNSAMLIVEKGVLRSGEFVVAGASFAPVRIMENFAGTPLTECYPGSPARVVGFFPPPLVGARWHAVKTKKEAEAEVAEERMKLAPKNPTPPAPQKNVVEEGAEEVEEEKEIAIVALCIKTDVAGTGEAVVHELQKIKTGERMEVRVVARGVGNITQDDVGLAGSGKTPGIIVGFNVKVDREARDLAERLGVTIEVFSIIYKLAEWLQQEIEKRRPRERQELVSASAKILKVFGGKKDRPIVGGRVEQGSLTVGVSVRIARAGANLGDGEIVSLQAGKNPAKKVEAGDEFGAMLKTSVEIAPGDMLEAIEVEFV